MKKIILTLSIIFTTLISSAQFVAVSDISQPADDESWSVSNFTNNAGLGYQVNDNLLFGLKKAGDDYDIFCRYNLGYGFYVSAQSATEDINIEEADLRLGYSLRVWNKLYIEPSYNRDSEFKVGAAYRF